MTGRCLCCPPPRFQPTYPHFLVATLVLRPLFCHWSPACFFILSRCISPGTCCSSGYLEITSKTSSGILHMSFFTSFVGSERGCCTCFSILILPFRPWVRVEPYQA